MILAKPEYRVAARQRRWNFFAGALLAALLFVPANNVTAQIPTFSSNVKVVNVPATVRNKKGEIVKDLTKDDFTLVEDGRPQTIRYFAKESDLPLTIGLLVDTSLSQRRLIGEERSASHAFLNQMLREDKDQAFIIHFEGEVELLQDLTSSREKLEAALNSLETPQIRRSGTWPGPGRGGGAAGMGTALYDAVFLASDEVISKQHGRKALIILSDGVDNASRVKLERAIEAAQRADALVYSILFADEQAYGGGWGRMGGPMGRRGGGYPRLPAPSTPNGKKVLERISKETGARMFEVSGKHSIQEIYARIEEELRSQYSLGYTPDKIQGGYHKIQLATRQHDLVVQARDGYYAQP